MSPVIEAALDTSASGNTSRRDRALNPGVTSEKPLANPEDRKVDRDPPAADDSHQGPKGIKGAFRKHPIAMIVCFGLIAVGVVTGIAWYLHARHFESTDDAFIDGRPVLVSPQVTGSIVNVKVTDNQLVKTGDLLATIDPRNYKAAVDQADGQIRQNEAAIKNVEAQIAAQKSQVEQASQQVTEAAALSNSQRMKTPAIRIWCRRAQAPFSARSRPPPTSLANRRRLTPPTRPRFRPNGRSMS